jgi:hypothetical protein
VPTGSSRNQDCEKAIELTSWNVLLLVKVARKALLRSNFAQRREADRLDS